MVYDPDAVEPCCHEAHPYTQLAALIRQDPEYAWSWHCVAAGAAMDEGIDHEQANRIASRLMQIMFNAATQHPHYSHDIRAPHDPTRLGQFPRSSIWEMLKAR